MRLVVVSNRLPVVIEQDGDTWGCRTGSGGLVTALSPILRRRGGLWIGWPGVSEQSLGVYKVLAVQAHTLGYELQPVWLTPEEQEGFYHGFANEIIWPLFHDLQSRCNFVPTYWVRYGAVNEKFADVVRHCTGPGDFIWVQDYHLMGLGRRLRQGGLSNRAGFFLHIPFPPPDVFCKLPWRSEVLEGLLSYDAIGFQTPRDRGNFADCVRTLLPGTRLRRYRGGIRAERDGRATMIGAFPIGIDYEEFAGPAACAGVTERVRALRGEMQSEQIVVGLDRLDYTKGIPDRLRAFRLALQNWPELQRRMTLIQVVVPSREAVPEYQDLKAEIERLVAQINGQYTQHGWVPIHYVFRSLEREELLAYYRAADVALLTPLKDGMNLVAKEYCACQIEGDGVLILSEFAGAAVQLRRDAVLVNPYDLEGVAEAIRRAVLMTRQERRPAMRRLRRTIQRQDIHWWTERFLQACGIVAELPGDVVPAGTLVDRVGVGRIVREPGQQLVDAGGR
jgi:alpha,alpha-trehalose-phosphate synthase [UDP-forming]